MQRANLCLPRLQAVALDKRDEFVHAGRDRWGGEEEREERGVVGEEGEDRGVDGDV